MAWAVRISLGLLVVAYAAWLGLPLAQALSSGQTIGQVWAGLAPSGSFQETGMAALLLVTIALYSLGGLATEVGFGWAPGLFFFGFVGEIALRLAVFSGAVVPAAPVLGIGAQDRGCPGDPRSSGGRNCADLTRGPAGRRALHRGDRRMARPSGHGADPGVDPGDALA